MINFSRILWSCDAIYGIFIPCKSVSFSLASFQNMKESDRRKVVPRVCILGGKAAPGYEAAKKIIKLCHAVAEKINDDSDVGDLLKLVRRNKFFSLFHFFFPSICSLSTE